MAATPKDVVGFWSAAGPEKWFAKNAKFDHSIALKFEPVHLAAARGEYDGWMATPEGARAFEDNVLRGNAFIEGTVANKLVSKSKNIAFRDPEDAIKNAEAINAFDRKIEEILQGRA